MPNTAEVISELATKLAYQKILADLQECKTINDIQALIDKYKAICDN